MLPVIDIKITDICDFGYNLNEQSNWMIGRAYCFDWKEIQDTATRDGYNLDKFLTDQIGYYLTVNRTKTKFLVWFSALNEMFFLTVCSKGGKANTQWLGNIPGYEEQGQDYLHRNSGPFMYYDGLNIYRVHFIFEKIEPRAHYVTDFGNLIMLNVAKTYKSNYLDIKQNPEKYFEYSVVPFESEQIIEWAGKKVIISHAFCNLAS